MVNADSDIGSKYRIAGIERRLTKNSLETEAPGARNMAPRD